MFSLNGLSFQGHGTRGVNGGNTWLKYNIQKSTHKNENSHEYLEKEIKKQSKIIKK